MAERRKKRQGVRKPCSGCGTWFTTDVRVGHRQKTCSDACRRERKARQRRAFATSNPHYWVERRLDARIEAIEEGTCPPESGIGPASLHAFPSEYAQSKMGTKALVILGQLGKVLLGAAQSEMEGQVAGLKAEFGKVLLRGPQSEIVTVGPPP